MSFRKNSIFFAMIAIAGLSHAQVNGSLVQLSEVALTRNPVLQRNVLAVKDAEADVQIQRSAFDYNLLSELQYQHTQYRLFASDPRNLYLDKLLKTNEWSFNAGIQKKLRTSQIIELGTQYSFNNNNIPFNSYSQPIPRYRGDYSGTLNLSVTQPLLRGRGRYVTTIPEKTAELFVEIIKDQNTYAASYEMLQIGSAYWNYYTAYQNLQIYRQNEARVRNVLDMTSELVKADKKPAGDLTQIQADLANQEKLTIQAEQSLFNAQTILGGSVGLNEVESRQIDVPQDSFPVIAEDQINPNFKAAQLLKIAIENRTDLAAYKKHLEALELQRQLAENNLKPFLDLTGFAFYGNASQGTAQPFVIGNVFGAEGRYVGAGAKLTLNFSINNNLAKGNYAKSQIALGDQQIVTDNLLRNIELNISNALNNLSSSALAAQRSKEALENYKTAFQNEQAKFQSGLTTLLNVILFQERLTMAELEYLRAQQQYALAIVNLRHETGTFFSQNNQILSISRDSFYRIPTVNY